MVVGCDGDLGGVAADGPGEGNDLHNAGGAGEDPLDRHGDGGRVMPAFEPCGTPRSTSTMGGAPAFGM